MTRLVSGVAMAAAVLAMILFLPTPLLRLVAGGVAALAAYEYSRLVGAGVWSVGAVWLGCGLASSGSATQLMLVPFVAIAAMTWQVLAEHEKAQSAAVGALSVIYIGLPLGLLVAAHARHGWPVTVLLIATVVVSDSAQYYTGRLLGRHALAPTISPKKTIEGAVGGVVFGTLFMMLGGARALPSASALQLAALGGAVVVLGICGDLFESQIKRQAGAKDSGTIIPGHGGVLDRIDALLFASPAFALYLGVIA
jgi:phosphatidate cytidylyltransferase